MSLHKNLSGEDLHNPKGVWPTAAGIPDNVSAAYQITESGTTDSYLKIDTTDDAEQVSVGNTTTNPELIQVGTGNVGLGTASPTEKVDISVTGANGGLRVKNDTDNAYLKLDAPTDEAAYIDFSTAESNDWQIGRRPNSNDLTIYDNDGANDYVVTFEQGGNVGIGTTDPGEKLDISLTGSNGGLRVKNDTDNAYLKVDAPADEAAYIDFSTAESNDWQIGRRPGSNDLTVYDNDGGAGYMVTFEQGGNVGIGTTNPSDKLHVNGAVTVSGKISGVTDPTNPQEAATKAYVDSTSGSTEVVNDTSPQLGGNLDCNGHDILLEGSEKIELSGGSIDLTGGVINATTGKGIHDESGNEQLLFTKVGSAVNYLNITNAATGGDATASTSTAPFISAAGETNVDLGLAAKGTGTVTVRADTNSGTLSLNSTGNTKTINITVPTTDSLGSSYTLTLPINDGNANDVLQSDGSGNLSWVAQSGGGLTVEDQNSNATLTGTNKFVKANTSGGAITLTLPAASTAGSGAIFVIKDIGNASAHAITLATSGSETIDGSTADIIINNNYASVEVVSDNSNWWIR